MDKAAKLAKGTNVLNEVGGVRISSQNTDKKIKEDSNLNNNHIERKKVNNNEYSTQIDNRVFEIEKLPLPSVVSRTFKDSNYRTVVSKESITVYRAFGGYADAGGTFVTTTPTINRIQAKLDLALLPEWKNTRNYEAIIEVPKGTVLNIGRAEKQITITGSILKGNADQVLLPRDYPLEWIKEIKQIPSR